MDQIKLLISINSYLALLHPTDQRSKAVDRLNAVYQIYIDFSWIRDNPFMDYL